MSDVMRITGRSCSKVEPWRDEGKLDMRKIDGEWCIHRRTLDDNLRALIESGEPPR